MGSIREAFTSGATIDEAAAAGRAVPADGGEPERMEHGLLALPSHHEPLATIYRHSWGSWMLERRGESTITVRDLEPFIVGDRTWQFHSPDRATSEKGDPFERPSALELTLTVSRDGECTGVRWRNREREHVLRTRDEDYLLLQLARRMRADADAGKSADACGWISESASRRDSLSRTIPLETAIFRLRKRLASLGVDGAADVVERQPEKRILRLGPVGVVIRDLEGSCDLSALKADRKRSRP